MKALSLRADYAWDVMTLEKTEEYRTWNTKHRGDLLICSTQQKMRGFVSGHALCVVSVTDVTYEPDDGIYTWFLDYRYPVVPFSVKGRQRLYNVDDALIKPAITGESTPEEKEAYRKTIFSLITF
ncbi:MAG: ASCH domain-containing protein [Eubacteriaceae bacterium]|nr:ASCH domain-containing protein [Eubacteriaceae bacterium]